MVEKGNTHIDAEHLPLDIREHLMRGQKDTALSVLVSEHGFNEADANQLIEEYRNLLRERKIALDIQIMHEQQAKDAKNQHHSYWLCGMRLALLAAGLVLIYILAKTI